MYRWFFTLNFFLTRELDRERKHETAAAAAAKEGMAWHEVRSCGDCKTDQSNIW